jgi:putative acyl-CoA dehydrogenase
MSGLYREAPLMGIWEGSGNVSALDTLRAMATRPACVEVLFDELATTAGDDARLDAHVAALEDLGTIQYRARKIAEDISLALQGSLLVRHGQPAVAEAFLATRMGGQRGGAFGTLPTGLDLAPILERALVKGRPPSALANPLRARPLPWWTTGHYGHAFRELSLLAQRAAKPLI